LVLIISSIEIKIKVERKPIIVIYVLNPS